MLIARGFCNKCGQCCGLDNGIPALPWTMFDVCRQYEENPDADLSSLPPGQVELYQLGKRTIGEKLTVSCGGKTFDVMVLTDEKYGNRRGLVRSETETHCPFLDVAGTSDPNAPGGVAHGCLIWDRTAWQRELCQGRPFWTRKAGEELTEDEEREAKQFLEDHPKCGFWLESS